MADFVRRVALSMSKRQPSITAGPAATVKNDGIPVLNFFMTGSISRPITDSAGPVMPRSVMYPVPLGNTFASDVCTCVCVPNSAEILPSRCQPMQIFSDVASAWKSQRTIPSRGSGPASSASTAANGQSAGDMNVRPIKLTTVTSPSCVDTVVHPRPGQPAGRLAGRTIRRS